MKKSIVAVLAIGLILSLGTVAMAAQGDAGTGIIGTYHDLSAASGKVTTNGDTVEQAGTTNADRICVYCHAPHNTRTVTGDTTFTYQPLWNHAVTTNAGKFIGYSNGSDNALFDQTSPLQRQHSSSAMILNPAGQPGSVSLLCLSCHDGSVAQNQYGYGSTVSKLRGAATTIAARAMIGSGGDLTNHHPIGFSYTAVQALDPELQDPALAGTVVAKAGGPTQISDLLWAGTQMECTSCHDVHNTQNAGPKFTWVDDQNSKFCLTCHLKGAI